MSKQVRIGISLSLGLMGLMLGPANPFHTLSHVPADGRGPNALLQNNALMAIVGCSELLLLQNAEDQFVRSQLETIREYALRAGVEVQQLQSGAA